MRMIFEEQDGRVAVNLTVYEVLLWGYRMSEADVLVYSI